MGLSSLCVCVWIWCLDKDTSHVGLEPIYINSFYLNYLLFNLMHMVNAAMKLKDTYSLEENIWQT